MVTVRTNNQGNGDEVVAKHLPVVLATLLDVDHKDLLKPEAQLGQDVELVQGAKFTVWPESPQVFQVHPSRRRIVDVLVRGQISN